MSGSGSWTVNENVTLPPITFPMVRFEISKGGADARGAAWMAVVKVVAMIRASVWSILAVKCMCRGLKIRNE